MTVLDNYLSFECCVSLKFFILNMCVKNGVWLYAICIYRLCVSLHSKRKQPLYVCHTGVYECIEREIEGGENTLKLMKLFYSWKHIFFFPPPHFMPVVYFKKHIVETKDTVFVELWHITKMGRFFKERNIEASLAPLIQPLFLH